MKTFIPKWESFRLPYSIFPSICSSVGRICFSKVLLINLTSALATSQSISKRAAFVTAVGLKFQMCWLEIYPRIVVAVFLLEDETFSTEACSWIKSAVPRF